MLRRFLYGWARQLVFLLRSAVLLLFLFFLLIGLLTLYYKVSPPSVSMLMFYRTVFNRISAKLPISSRSSLLDPQPGELHQARGSRLLRTPGGEFGSSPGCFCHQPKVWPYRCRGKHHHDAACQKPFSLAESNLDSKNSRGCPGRTCRNVVEQGKDLGNLSQRHRVWPWGLRPRSCRSLPLQEKLQRVNLKPNLSACRYHYQSAPLRCSYHGQQSLSNGKATFFRRKLSRKLDVFNFFN